VTDVSSDRVVDLDDAVPKGSAISIVTSPVLMLMNKTFPAQSLFGRIAHALSQSGHGTAFLKDALPDRWHLKHSELVPPVLAVADIGWMIRVDNAHLKGLSAIHAETRMDGFAPTNDKPSAGHRSRTRVRLPANHPHKGAHGFDNVEPDMQALFIATGPAFRKRRRIRGMRAVDLYPLLCHMFGAEPAPNNGSVHISEAAILPVSFI
jgi:ectonucleotide pyrophosphatase/phosphodiesterase family member 5